jgi:hypothetical protein
MSGIFSRDDAERLVLGINALLTTCNELAGVDGLSVREIIAALNVVAIEVAKQSGEISRDDFMALTRHLAKDAKRNLS